MMVSCGSSLPPLLTSLCNLMSLLLGSFASIVSFLLLAIVPSTSSPRLPWGTRRKGVRSTSRNSRPKWITQTTQPKKKTITKTQTPSFNVYPRQANKERLATKRAAAFLKRPEIRKVMMKAARAAIRPLKQAVADARRKAEQATSLGGITRNYHNPQSLQ